MSLCDDDDDLVSERDQRAKKRHRANAEPAVAALPATTTRSQTKAAQRLQRWWRRTAAQPGYELLNARGPSYRKNTVSRGGKSVLCPVTMEPIPLRRAFYNFVDGKMVVYDVFALAGLVNKSLCTKCPCTQTELLQTQINRAADVLDRLDESLLADDLMDNFANMEELVRERNDLQSLQNGMEGMVTAHMSEITTLVCNDAFHPPEVVAMNLVLQLHEWRGEVLRYYEEFREACVVMLRTDAQRFADERFAKLDAFGFVAEFVEPAIRQMRRRCR